MARGAVDVAVRDVGGTSSGVSWLYPPPSSIGDGQIAGASSNTDRRAIAVAVSIRSSPATWFAAETGLRLVPKGFEVTGPTIHTRYLEMPLIAVLQTGPTDGLFVEGGLVGGLRVQCRRFAQTVSGFHEDGCDSATLGSGIELEPLRRWDLSWDAAVGGRVALGTGRVLLTARFQRSLLDIQPDDSGRKMVNRVWMLVAGYEWDVFGPTE